MLLTGVSSQQAGHRVEIMIGRHPSVCSTLQGHNSSQPFLVLLSAMLAHRSILQRASLGRVRSPVRQLKVRALGGGRACEPLTDSQLSPAFFEASCANRLQFMELLWRVLRVVRQHFEIESHTLAR